MSQILTSWSSDSQELVVPLRPQPSRSARSPEAPPPERIETPLRLHHFFERQCDVTPDALALICGTDQLSYAALDARANRLARYLARLGVAAGDTVGILLERSVHTYVTLLAVLKCGAAFVPIDPSFPAERITFIAEDAGLALLVTTAGLASRVAAGDCRVLKLDTDAVAIARQPASRPAVPEAGDALCYIIYTSGTTGRPKGVAIHHSNICNFLMACTPIYGVGPDDRVYQGMTISFDFSIEEIWPTFSVGATLVAGPTDHRRLGAGLAEFLVAHEISVLYCVPTLLATLDRDVPTLHTLIVGGEACPLDLVKRSGRPGRRMLNTYGPTETTVTATWGLLRPDRPVTIGKPLPTYTAHILDASLCPVAAGEPGEICIGGAGVASGYVNRPELTAARFVADPFAGGRARARLYRTGDLGRLTPDGEIEFLGRIDSQVKIRGYRIELAEIEAVVLEDGAVENVVVAVVPPDGDDNGRSGVEELAAYATLRRPAADPDGLKDRLHAALRGRLPAYMVPAFIEFVDALPTLPSGKADRSRLPRPASPRLGARVGTAVPPATPMEEEIAAAWGAVFGRSDVSVEADFFAELGGHSLLAAMVVSKLREKPALRRLAIGDLYAHPTVRSLAWYAEEEAAKREARAPGGATALTRPSGTRSRGERVGACGAAQSALLYLLWMVLGAPFAWPLMSSLPTALTLPVAVVAALVLVLVMPIAAKWLLIGRFRPGRYKLWGWYYCRWWIARKAVETAPLDQLAGSPLMALYLRLLGARIGQGCYIGTARLLQPDLVEIGDGASIGYGVEIQPWLVEDGWLYLEPIRIGAGAFIGTNAVVLHGSVVGRGARVAEQSLVTRGQSIPAHQSWAGSPSERTTDRHPLLDAIAANRPIPAAALARQEAPAGRWTPALLAGFIAGTVLLELLPVIAAAPGLWLAFGLADYGPLWALAVAPLAGLSFVLLVCALVAAGKRLVLPEVRPGIYPLYSGFGLRKWLVDKLMMSSLVLTNTLYATLYALPWLRLLGAKIGRMSEVSTVSHIDPDLLTLGAESFVADLAVLGAACYHDGAIALGTTQLGTRCFVGNAAQVPGNTQLADNTLIGVQSVPPKRPAEPGSAWLGSPSIFLPRRQSSGSFDESVTYRPTRRLVATRLAIEFFRVMLPAVLVSGIVILGSLAARRIAAVGSIPLLVAALPLCYGSATLLAFAVVVALKWLVVGRYRPRVEPLWSHFVWRTELITGLYESAVVVPLLRWLTGTPLLPVFLRLLGARIGRRVYLDTTFLTEFDLVEVGDEAMIAGPTSLQTHLFEDRVMKMSVVKVGPKCAVGPRSVVLYDSALEEGAGLDALSLVMKGEVLPQESRWRGIPARLAE
jgi:non-ribosomal peptide synthetase-like protein